MTSPHRSLWTSSHRLLSTHFLSVFLVSVYCFSFFFPLRSCRFHFPQILTIIFIYLFVFIFLSNLETSHLHYRVTLGSVQVKYENIKTELCHCCNRKDTYDLGSHQGPALTLTEHTTISARIQRDALQEVIAWELGGAHHTVS